jgi:LPS sulfotransferase NodH
MPETRAARTRFVILAAPRTGSNMLCTLLNSHPEILCHHEIFNPEAIYYALDRRDGRLNLGTFEERNRRPLEFLQRVWNTDCGFPCVGFKFCRDQNQDVFQAVCDDSGVKKTVIRRRNRVKTYVSELVAEQTGVWEAYREHDIPKERPKVHVDPAAFQQNRAVNEVYYTAIECRLRASDQAFLTVTYEELFGVDERMRVLQFLGVKAAELEDADRLRIGSVKQNSTDLRELIANFAPLQAAWKGTELERELIDCTY